MTEGIPTPPRPSEAMQAASEVTPEFQRLVREFVGGQIMQRPKLDRRTRLLCAISVLAGLGRELQLKIHIASALRAEIPKDEIIEALLQVSVYAGFPATWNGLLAAREMFAEHEAAGG